MLEMITILWLILLSSRSSYKFSTCYLNRHFDFFCFKYFVKLISDVRRPSLSVPGFKHSFTTDTTYQTNVENIMQVKTQ